MIGASIVTGATFIWLQHRRETLGGAQTLPMNLLRNSAYFDRIGCNHSVFSGIAGVVLVLSIFLQSGLKLTAGEAGLAIVAHPISVVAASVIAGRFGTRWLELRICAEAMFLSSAWYGYVRSLRMPLRKFRGITFNFHYF
ncbi:MAG: hypothetical protein ABJO67_11685 [Pseudoruegeria sp.]